VETVLLDRWFHGALAWFALFAAAASLAPGLAAAQVVSPSQVTPSNLLPPAARSGAITLSNAAGLTPPPNASGLSVTISNVSIDGGFPEGSISVRFIRLFVLRFITD
jgi:hypothetical protein